MNSLSDDMKSMLNRYVKTKSHEEIKSNDKQLGSELKVNDEKTSCNCEIRIQDLIRDVLIYVSCKDKNKNIFQKITTEYQMFDSEIRHFEECKVDKSKHPKACDCDIQFDGCEVEERSLNDDLNRLLIPVYDQFENEDEPTACDCDIRRQDLIVDLIYAIITKASAHKIKEIEYFDKTSGHFNDCERGNNFVGNTTSESRNSWRHWEISVCSSEQCDVCDGEERSLNDGLNRPFIPVCDQLENEDEM